MDLIKKLSDKYLRINDWFSDVKGIYYKKSLENTINDSKEMLKTNDDLGIYLQLPRIERFAIDRYCSQKTEENRILEEKVRAVVEKAYQRAYDESYDLLIELEKNPVIKNNRDYKVWEPEDGVTRRYLYPRYIYNFYNDIIKPKIDETYFFISLSHGATRAGISLSLGLNIEHLPIRLSMHKKRDEWPHIDDKEFLDKVKGKNLFVFDEDVASGVTLYTFNKFLKSLNLTAEYGSIYSPKYADMYKPDYYLIEG